MELEETGWEGDENKVGTREAVKGLEAEREEEEKTDLDGAAAAVVFEEEEESAVDRDATRVASDDESGRNRSMD